MLLVPLSAVSASLCSFCPLYSGRSVPRGRNANASWPRYTECLAALRNSHTRELSTEMLHSDWKWRNQDGGPGKLGKVTKVIGIQKGW